MKIAITGTTRGLGKYLFDSFSVDNTVITFNRGDNLNYFLHGIKGVDLFISSSYLDGYQVQLFDQTKNIVEKMVVIGSIAADNQDPYLPEYSVNKRTLQDKIQIPNENILYLKLTGLSYRKPQAIVDVINLWLQNPIFKTVEFYPDE
jgi:methionine synthase II (cobalamin-independent)